MSHGWLHRMRSAGVGLAFLAGLVFAGLLHLPNFSSAQQPSTPAVSTPAPAASPAGVAALANLSEAFASVAEHVKPSVVFIKSGKTEKREQRPQLQLPPGFEQFFPRMPQAPPARASPGGPGRGSTGRAAPTRSRRPGPERVNRQSAP